MSAVNVKGWRYDYASRQWLKIRRLPNASKCWLATVKGKQKRALKHLLLEGMSK
jgi:hypothetical protein